MMVSLMVFYLRAHGRSNSRFLEFGDRHRKEVKCHYLREVFLQPAQCKELLQAGIFILGLYREVLVLVIFPAVSTDTRKKKALLGFTIHFEKSDRKV